MEVGRPLPHQVRGVASSASAILMKRVKGHPNGLRQLGLGNAALVGHFTDAGSQADVNRIEFKPAPDLGTSNPVQPARHLRHRFDAGF